MVMTMITRSSFADNRTLPREDLKRRVYDAAIALFRARGFEATTVEEIAKTAQVAKGTVFNFFPTKSAILLHYYEGLDDRFGAAMAAMSPADPRAELVRFWGEAEALLRKEGPMADAIFRAVASDPDIGNADIDSGDKDRGAMVAYFRACRAEGTLNEKIEPVVAAHVVSDLWIATVMDWLRFGRRYSLKLRLATKVRSRSRASASSATDSTISTTAAGGSVRSSIAATACWSATACTSPRATSARSSV
jgi:AcrR family transcriptional regulator